jgi:hypothetical protein
LVGLLPAGCESDPPATPAQPAQPPAPTSFDPASCGTITGLVTWVGPVPVVHPARQLVIRADDSGYDLRSEPLANAPKIDPNTRGLDAAVVFLREVNPATAKPWNLPPAAVEIRDGQILVDQNKRATRAGFVRRGDSVEMRSREPYLHILRGRGAAYFALPFPEQDRPLSHRFDSCGRVDLTSATGSYWQAAYLFVCDHPYNAVCDAEGRFTFTDVPPGQYDLVAWHPNWNVARAVRHLESGQVHQLVFEPPLESSRPVVVNRGRTTLANITFPK